MRNQLIYKSWTWDDDNVTYGYIDKELSLPVSSLGIDTLQAGVVCDDPSILDFEQNDPLLVFHKGKQKGLFYIQSITQTGPNNYEIIAISPLGRLAQMSHKGGKYDNVPLAQLVGSICGDVPFIIKSNLTSIRLSGWLPLVSPEEGIENGDARDNLAQVLFAIGANLSTDNNGVLRIQNMWDGLASYIDGDRVYREGATVRRDTPVSVLTLVEHQWVEGGATTTLFDGTATEGQVVIFQEPMYDLTASGVTIKESGANYAVLAAGTGTITGRPYLHLTREITRSVGATNAKNTKYIKEGTLVTLLNSAAVANRLADYYAHRTTISETIIVAQEHPGNVVSIMDPWARKQVKATIGRSGEQLSGIIRGAIEALVGFIPPQAENQEYLDYRVLLTGSGTWTVPTGVTQITVVLIGGGTGGLPGSAGYQAPALSPRSYTNTLLTQTDHRYGYGFDARGQTDDSLQGGAGGEAGQPGEGGKILRLDLAVVSGQTFSFRCGLGGLGTDFGSETVHEGGETTFGSYSSANGARNPQGFTDPITGDVYGVTGKAGVPGGNGASPGETPPGVAADGQVWQPGSHPSGTVQAERGSVSQNYGRQLYHADASYGGGAAYGAPGGDGLLNGSGSFGTRTVSVTAATKGSGATALPPPAATKIGQGGPGGNGGGGEGSIGLTYSGCDVASGVTASTLSASAVNAVASHPGNGSKGGDAAAGGIAIFYRLPVEHAQDGLFVEQRQKRFLVDKTGRYYIT